MNNPRPSERTPVLRPRSLTRPIAPAGLLLVAACAFSAVSAVSAADWAGWLGPNHDGVSPETGVFTGGPFELEVAWRKPLGLGYSGIAVADGLAITVYGDGESDWVVAYSAADGDERWRYRIGRMFPKTGNADGGQNGMPIVDGGAVYHLANQGKLFALNLEDGSELWSLSITETLGARAPKFGHATLPLPVGDLLFVQTGGDEGRALTAFDRKTGEVRWSTQDDGIGYGSPIVTELAGRRVILAVTNRRLLGLDPVSGDVVWSKEYDLVIGDGSATPVLLGGDRFFILGDNESGAFRVSKRKKKRFEVEEVWRSNSFKRTLATPVLRDGHLYGYDGTFLTCVNADTGETVWKAREAASKGLILVDGQLVLFDNDGALVIVAATPKGFSETARLPLSDEGSYTYPSFSDGKIFVRNLKEIVVVAVRHPTAE
jgi:outer membrane protein assembly factor BamB